MLRSDRPPRREDVWWERSLSRGATAAFVFTIAAIGITVGSTYIGFAPGIGDPVPGEVRQSVLTAAVFGIALVCVCAIAALRRTLKPRRTMWLALIPGVLLLLDGIRVGRGYTGDGRAALWMILAAPIVTLALTRFRAGAARVYITTVALMALVLLIVLFEVGLRTN